MDTQSGRGWLGNAFAIFLFALSLWILVALWAGNTFGATFPLLADLRSHIFADYGSDVFGRTLKSLQLTILGDITGYNSFTEGAITDWNLAFQNPVPTATQHIEDGSAGLSPTQSVDPTEPAHTTTAELEPTYTLGPEAPAETPVLTKTPQPTYTPSPLPVRPILECVQNNHDGNFTAFFGYKNPNSHSIHIGVGQDNHFSPAPENRGQPTQFEPGRTQPYPNAAFSVVFGGNEIAWHLGEKKAFASSESLPCNFPKPEPTPKQDDVEAPILSGGILMPPPGELTVCEIDVSIIDLEVNDPPWSSGIEWVKLKFLVEGYSDYVYSPPLILQSGGPTAEGGWRGCYSGEIHIEIDPGWKLLEPELFIVSIWAKARDNAGLEGYLWLAEYNLPASCGGNLE